MVARFMRFYPAYTDSLVLGMPAQRFFALNKHIRRLQAEEEVTALSIAHSGDPGERMRDLMAEVKGKKPGKTSQQYVSESIAGAAGFEEKPGEIAELRARQKEAAERVKKEQKEWLEQQKRLKEQQTSQG